MSTPAQGVSLPFVSNILGQVEALLGGSGEAHKSMPKCSDSDSTNRYHGPAWPMGDMR